MNLVLFESHELVENQVLLYGRRAEHILSILGLTVGDDLRVGMVCGRIGRGTVVETGDQSVTLQVHLEREPAPVPPVELILALPRPIMLQRIIKQATVLGVRHLHLIRSAKVEKSFFHSPVLQPEKIRSLLLEGMEQAMDSRLPDVTIYHRFKPFVEDVVPTLTGQGIIAHPAVQVLLPDVYPLRQKDEPKILLAVGPEGGWNEFELECFRSQGFDCFSMGNRILHVDTAVVALLAQLQLLAAIHYR
jgi:RsmE family RNA methyltransferase